MDNQQERLVSKEFIAGLLVGEGTFTLAVCRDRKKVRIKPMVSMQMNDGETMQIVLRSLHALGLPAHVYHRPQRGCWTLQAAGFKRISAYLAVLLEDLTGAKREAAEIVGAFIESRSKVGKFEPYSDYEIGLVERIRTVNGVPGRKRNPISDLRGQVGSRQWKARPESSETNTLSAVS